MAALDWTAAGDAMHAKHGRYLHLTVGPDGEGGMQIVAEVIGRPFKSRKVIPLS